VPSTFTNDVSAATTSTVTDRDAVAAPESAVAPGSVDDFDDFVFEPTGPTGPRELADARTLEALDFFAVRELVALQTTTDRAGVRARSMVPHVAIDAVRLEQGATVEMRAIANDAGFSIQRSREVGELVALAARGGALTPEDLRDVGGALASADAAVRGVRAGLAPILQARSAAARPLPEVAAAIDRAVGEDGQILDRASPALAKIRRAAAHAQNDARDRCATILRQARYAKAIQDSIVTVRDGRFVVPVKAEFSGMLPGVVHDTSSTGHTLFVEPLDALDVNNRVRTLRIDEQREVLRILAELSALVGSRAAVAEINLDVLADLDLVLARVRVAQAMAARAPIVLDVPHVDVRAGRHPLLLDRAVPQSVALDDDVQMVIISGPNMGGKTVALKLVGLFVAMTYCGMQLPTGDGTTIGSFDYLGCEVGDEQSIAGNASTFSAHLMRLRTLVGAAGPQSLVLIDEIASGTEPASSAALGIAVVERLLARGVRGIVTTHSTDLKLFAHDTAHVLNASVRFDPATYRPTYQLDLGSPGRSLAFPLARALGSSPVSSSARSHCSRRASAITIARSPSSPTCAPAPPPNATRSQANARPSTGSSASPASARTRSSASGRSSRSRPASGSARRYATLPSSSSAASASGPRARARAAAALPRARRPCSGRRSRTSRGTSAWARRSSRRRQNQSGRPCASGIACTSRRSGATARSWTTSATACSSRSAR